MRFWGREVIVSGTGLVCRVAHQDAFVGEMAGQHFGIVQLSSRIAPHVEDESRAGAEEVEDICYVAFSDAVRETLIGHIPHVVLQDAVFQSRSDAIIRAEVAVAQFGTEVLGVVLVP